MTEKFENQEPDAERLKQTYSITRGTFGGRTPFAGQSVIHDVKRFGQIYDGKGDYTPYENLIKIDGDGNLTCIHKFDDENKKDDVWIEVSKNDYKKTDNSDGSIQFHIQVVDGSYLLNGEKVEI